MHLKYLKNIPHDLKTHSKHKWIKIKIYTFT